MGAFGYGFKGCDSLDRVLESWGEGCHSFPLDPSLPPAAPTRPPGSPGKETPEKANQHHVKECMNTPFIAKQFNLLDVRESTRPPTGLEVAQRTIREAAAKNMRNLLHDYGNPDGVWQMGECIPSWDVRRLSDAVTI